MLTFGSLFSGIGGIDLGLERSGWTCKWQVEIDPFCRKVLEKHWPHVTRYGDIRELSGNELIRVYLLAGGFPCQDLSLAGKGAGLAGERSGLWFEYLRIICALRPRWVLVENVPGLFVRGIDTVLGGLAEAGYDTTWFSLQAADFEAPHKRERVVILGYSKCPEWWPGEYAGHESDRENARWPEASGWIGTSGQDGRTGNVADSKICCQRPGLCQDEQGQQRRGRFSNIGSEDVAHASGSRLSVGGSQESWKVRDEAWGPEPERRGFDVANTYPMRKLQPQGSVKELRGWPGNSSQGVGLADTFSQGLPEWEGEEGERAYSATAGSGRGSVESLLGRVFDGFSGGVDRYRWPAERGQEQYEWEPPRVATGIKNRVPRLKGLGNAVVPAMAELIGWIIREVENENSKGFPEDHKRNAT